MSCGRQWDLIEPNEEDRELGINHECILPSAHEGLCRCGCGAIEGDT